MRSATPCTSTRPPAAPRSMRCSRPWSAPAPSSTCCAIRRTSAPKCATPTPAPPRAWQPEHRAESTPAMTLPLDHIVIAVQDLERTDRKSTRLNSSHLVISYAVFCLKKKKNSNHNHTHKLVNCLVGLHN